MMKRKNINRPFCWILLLSLLGISCQPDFDKMAPQSSGNDSLLQAPKVQKVLVLIADGARGQALFDMPAASIPNLSQLKKKSTYSWFSLSDELANEASSWTDMFTGVTKEKHGVLSSNFSANKLGLYPTVFKRIKDSGKDVRISTFSFSDVFTNNLTADETVDVRQTFLTDQGVNAALVAELSQEKAGVVVGLYGDINKAGSQFGYNSTVPAYATAIKQFDAYVGEVMTALKARKNYNNENWMVIVTSSRGGDYPVLINDGTIFSKPKANTFTLFYNPGYREKLIPKPFTGNPYTNNFVKITGGTNSLSTTAVRAEMINVPDALNFGTRDFTIELKVRKDIRAGVYSYQFPIFFGRKQNKGTGNGWYFSWEGTRWAFGIRNAATGATAITLNGTDIVDGNWHTISVVVKTVSGVKTIQGFTDGRLVGTQTAASVWLDLPVDVPAQPIAMGWTSGSTNDNGNPFSGYIADVKMWLVALPETTIANYACETQLSGTHPYINFLAGYWPCTDGSGTVFKDLSTVGSDFKIVLGGVTQQPYQAGTPIAAPAWHSATAIVCPPATTDLSTVVPNTKDITPQILTWLGIPIVESWKIDGRVYLNN